MIAAIPYFGLGTYNLPIPGLGNLPLDPWAILVCFGFVFGLEVGRARAIRLGMDVRDIVDGAVVTVGTGFVVGHIFTVVFYFPERLTDEGIWAILKLWTGFSSMGGFVGAVLGSVLFYTVIRKRPYWRYADVISFGFPFGWLFGRLGCGVVHDHVGSTTTLPFGMDFDAGIKNFQWVAGDPFPWADGIRHELGLYEMAYMIPVCLVWLWLAKKDWPPGFFTALFGAVYMPVRFGLDFLRNSDLQNQDARYLLLTPAQWGCIIFFGVCLFVLYRLDWKGFRPWPMDSLPDQARRALEEKRAEPPQQEAHDGQ
jgi:phosphatidylglycerol:prolipoprotein diacylglycerol transferase